MGSANFLPPVPSRGRWTKKVHGKLKYFENVATDPKGVAALHKWLEQKDELLAGRTPRSKTDGLTLRELCNKFLVAKLTNVKIGKLSPRTFVEYNRTTDILIETFDKDRSVLDIRRDDPSPSPKGVGRAYRRNGLTHLATASLLFPHQ